MKKFRVTIVVLILVVLGLVYYAYLSGKETPTPAESVTEVSELDKLIARDLDADYPNTPRKVLDFYSQITVCFYEEGLTDENLQKLCDQSVKLFDAELLLVNPESTFLENTKAEIEEFRAIERKITDYVLEETNQIEYYKEDGRECAKISVKYFLYDESGFSRTYEDFLMRKDENGRWKILGWQMTPANEQEE